MKTIESARLTAFPGLNSFSNDLLASDPHTHTHTRTHPRAHTPTHTHKQARARAYVHEIIQWMSGIHRGWNVGGWNMGKQERREIVPDSNLDFYIVLTINILKAFIDNLSRNFTAHMI